MREGAWPCGLGHRMACFLSCISCCLLVLHQPSSSHHHVAPLLRQQQGGKYKGDKHTLILTSSYVYVFSSLLSPRHALFLAHSLAHFSLPLSLLFVYSSSHVVVVMHKRDFFGDPGPPWRAARVCHLSPFHPFFSFLLFTFFSLITLIQACSLSRNQ